MILWAVRWYLQFPISYRDLERMLADRGVVVDHTTLSPDGVSALPRSCPLVHLSCAQLAIVLPQPPSSIAVTVKGRRFRPG